MGNYPSGKLYRNLGFYLFIFNYYDFYDYFFDTK